MIFLSFLGTNDYKPANYNVGFLPGNHPDIIKASFSQEVVQKVFNPDRIFVGVTQESYKKNGEKLAEVKEYEKIRIPSGQSSDELWTIVQILVDKLPADEEYIIDVTHGFRSLPLITTTLINLLRARKSIHVQHILYFTFDSKREINPVFDLTPIIYLQDVAFAQRSFKETGSLATFSQFFKDFQKEAYINQAPKKPENLTTFGKNLTELQQALALNDLAKVTSVAQEILHSTADVQEELALFPSGSLFIPYIDELRDDLKRFAVNIDLTDSNSLASLKGLKFLCVVAEENLRQNLLQQFYTISLELLDIKIKTKLSIDLFNHESEEFKKFLQQGEKNKLDGILKEMYGIRDSVSKKRNQINHAGIGWYGTEKYANLNRIKSEAKNLLNAIRTLLV